MVMLAVVDTAQKLCLDVGCSWDGNYRGNDSLANDTNSGFKCSCLASCQVLHTCCEDYLQICGGTVSKLNLNI